jgi:hypothetical protein
MLVVVCAVAVMIGPFGTFTDLSPVERLIYWTAIVGLNWGQARLANYAIRRIAGQERFWLAAVGGSVAAALPATLEVLFLEQTFRPAIAARLSFVELYPQVLALTLLVMVPVSWFFMRGGGAAAPAARAAAPGERFWRRLPVALGRDLYAVRAEDHYIRVYTASGDDLVLHRFSDAVTELEGLEGLRVHRSWWVARNGLAGVERRDRKVFLKLRNGEEAPVSRTYLPAVRNAGWLS